MGLGAGLPEMLPEAGALEAAEGSAEAISATVDTAAGTAESAAETGAESASEAETGAATAEEPQYVYRVHGGNSGPWGHSWTPENPLEMDNPRAESGLPKGNAGQFLTKAAVQDTEGVITRSALPLDGNPGNAEEWLFPDPESQLSEILDHPIGPAVLGVRIERFAREDVREVLERYGIHAARRATTTDATEEVVLLNADEYKKTQIEELTLALMDVLPHVKVWVAPVSERWRSEPI